jgi:hypothetical protein
MEKIISRNLGTDRLSKASISFAVGFEVHKTGEGVFLCFEDCWDPPDTATELDAVDAVDFVDADEDGDFFG